MGEIFTLKDFENIHIVINYSADNDKMPGVLELINELCLMVNEAFPINKKEILIIFEPQRKDPIYLRESKTVMITPHIEQWNAIVYELSHELCHFGVIDEVPQANKWFEESICEVASYYFLLKMAKLYHLKYLATKEEKYKRYMEFVATYSRQSENFKIFSTGDLVIGKDKALLDVLQKNEKLREYNRYIAIKILPVFQTNPQLWECIQYLGSVDAEHPYAFLLQWNTICQKNIGIDVYEIIQTLGWSNILRI